MRTVELYDFCGESILEEKLFIVPSRTIGMQMVNKMAMDGHPSINLKIATLQGFAFEVCNEYIINNNKLVIDFILGNNLILSILKDLVQKDFFFKENLIDSKTAEEVYKVIMELKYGGMTVFPEIKNLDKIYEVYQKRLLELNAMDYCDILLEATKSSDLSTYSSNRIAVAANIEFNKLEEMLFEKLTANGCTKIKMPVHLVEGHPKNYYYKENELHDKNIRFYEGYGTKEEIGFIIDDIKRKRIPLDEVVIGYTNGKYADLIHIEFERENIPLTFGAGLGIETSSTFRFIKTIFSWAINYYNLNEIRPIFANGDIKIEGISAPEIYDELIKYKVISLRENYERKLAEIKENQYGRKETNKIKWIKEFFSLLLEVLPVGHIRLNQYVPKLIHLVKVYVKDINKYDGTAKQAIIETLDKISSIHMEVSKEEYFEMILAYIKESKILRSQPQPGKVFITSFKNAGYSGRKNLYLVGLDSNSLSNKAVESPILLDIWKNKTSNEIDFAKDGYEYKKYKIKELLTSDFENITIGYSNFDTVNIKVQSPSQVYNELKDLLYKEEEVIEEVNRRILGRDVVESATALEILAECPRRFYLRYLMYLEPKEEVEIRVDRWLDPPTKGLIVHEVLKDYFDFNEVDQTRENLLNLVGKQCAFIAKEKMYLLQEVYEREKESLVGICENIINTTMADEEWKILVNELSFGDRYKKYNKVFGILPNQTIDIMGLELQVSGAIDRVDVSVSNENIFRIIDYKTGSRSNFDKLLRVTTGRGKSKTYDYSQTQKLQYYIYKKVLEEILAYRNMGLDKKIEKFTYLFEGDGERGVIDLDFDDEFVETIEERIVKLLDMDILESQKEVSYEPDTKCKYCEYSPICVVDKEFNGGEEDSFDE